MDDRPSNRPDRGEPAPPYLGRQGPPAPAQVSERMQSLLARAVEDQMAEQRQLQSLINEVRSALTRIQDRMESVAQGNVLEDTRADVAALAGELRSATAGLSDRLDAAVTAINDHSRADALAARLDSVTAELEAQSQAVAGLPTLLAQATAAESADTRVEIARLTAAVTNFGDGIRTEMAGLRESLAADSAEHARRYTEYVDNAILSLAEVLLRRRGDRPAAAPAAAAPVAPLPEPVPEPVPEVVEAPAAVVAEDAPATGLSTWEAEPEPVAAQAPAEPAVEESAPAGGSFFRPVEDSDLVEEEDLPYTEWEQDPPAFREVQSPSPEWGPPTTPPVSLDLRDTSTIDRMERSVAQPVPGGYDDGHRAWWRPGG